MRNILKISEQTVAGGFNAARNLGRKCKYCKRSYDPSEGCVCYWANVGDVQ